MAKQNLANCVTKLLQPCNNCTSNFDANKTENSKTDVIKTESEIKREDVVSCIGPIVNYTNNIIVKREVESELADSLLHLNGNKCCIASMQGALHEQKLNTHIVGKWNNKSVINDYNLEFTDYKVSCDNFSSHYIKSEPFNISYVTSSVDQQFTVMNQQLENDKCNETSETEEEDNSAFYKYIRTAGNRCSYAFCINNRRLQPGYHFFNFPTDTERSRQWIINSGNLKLLDLPHKLLIKRHLCQEHFEDRAFRNSLQKNLNKTAFPIPYKTNDVKDQVSCPTSINTAPLIPTSVVNNDINMPFVQHKPDDKFYVKETLKLLHLPHQLVIKKPLCQEHFEKNTFHNSLKKNLKKTTFSQQHKTNKVKHQISCPPVNTSPLPLTSDVNVPLIVNRKPDDKFYGKGTLTVSESLNVNEGVVPEKVVKAISPVVEFTLNRNLSCKKASRKRKSCLRDRCHVNAKKGSIN